MSMVTSDQMGGLLLSDGLVPAWVEPIVELEHDCGQPRDCK